MCCPANPPPGAAASCRKVSTHPGIPRGNAGGQGTGSRDTPPLSLSHSSEGRREGRRGFPGHTLKSVRWTPPRNICSTTLGSRDDTRSGSLGNDRNGQIFAETLAEECTNVPNRQPTPGLLNFSLCEENSRHCRRPPGAGEKLPSWVCLSGLSPHTWGAAGVGGRQWASKGGDMLLPVLAPAVGGWQWAAPGEAIITVCMASSNTARMSATHPHTLTHTQTAQSFTKERTTTREHSYRTRRS